MDFSGMLTNVAVVVLHSVGCKMTDEKEDYRSSFILTHKRCHFSLTSECCMHPCEKQLSLSRKNIHLYERFYRFNYSRPHILIVEGETRMYPALTR